MSKEKVVWFEKHCHAMERLFSIVYEIKDLARAFNTTGNNRMHNLLIAISKDLESIHEQARDSVNQQITENLKASEKASADLLGLVISKEMKDFCESTEKLNSSNEGRYDE